MENITSNENELNKTTLNGDDEIKSAMLKLLETYSCISVKLNVGDKTFLTTVGFQRIDVPDFIISTDSIATNLAEDIMTSFLGNGSVKELIEGLDESDSRLVVRDYFKNHDGLTADLVAVKVDDSLLDQFSQLDKIVFDSPKKELYQLLLLDNSGLNPMDPRYNYTECPQTYINHMVSAVNDPNIVTDVEFKEENKGE